MVVPALALLLALCKLQAVDTYGKSEAQILQMGQTAWFNFYTGKAGDSTAAMTNASGIYADIAAARNDRLLADPRQPRRGQVKNLRKMLLEFGGDMLSLGSEVTGGGTIWNNLSAEEYADAQDTIYGVIHPQGQSRPKSVIVSDVLKALGTIPAKIKHAEEQGVIEKGPMTTAPKDIKAAKALFRQIARIASTYDRSTSDRILGYCLAQAKLVDSF